MRSCATASAAFVVLLSAVAAVSACSGNPPPSQPPDTTKAAPPPPPPPAQSDAAPAASPPAASAQSAQATRRKAPETAADCKELLTEITNEPPESGVVMNNAATAADAGGSDRLLPIVDTIKLKRDSFRCCFDLYARKVRGAHGKITLRLKLKPDGSVEEAGIVPEKSDITAREVDSCMADLVRSIPWARSPSGKETVLTYPFDFKSRN